LDGGNDGRLEFKKGTFMSQIELTIKLKNWIAIFISGVLLASLLSIMIYFIVQASLIDGFFFGLILGTLIPSFSLIFISLLNAYLLPKLPKTYWNPLAAITSFLAGFLATLSTFSLTHLFSITLLTPLMLHPYTFASITGVITYLIGFIFYQMVKMNNQREHADYLLTKNRLKSLELQLNPHFLFNALNSLAELIYVDKSKSEDMIFNLASFLRSGMKEQSLISIEEELENITTYIAIENIRYNNTIVLDIQSDSTLRNQFIPKFSLQLLVENSIKHGFNPRENTHTIYIFIQQEHPHIVMRVQNSGQPIKEPRFGIGLNNLQERLNLLCNGSLSIAQTYPATYEIRFTRCHT
jgi:two-component system LytT family sensor kinase